MKEKRVRRWAWLLFLTAVCLLLPEFKTSAESYKENTQFDIEVHYGQEDTVRVGRDASFQVTLRNHGEDFDGTVRLLTSAYEEDGYYTSWVSSISYMPSSGVRYYDNCGYEKSLTIPSGGQRKVTFDLPYTGGAPFIKIILANADGEMAAEKVLRISVRSSYSEILIGALTEDIEKLEFMDGIHLKDYPNITVSLVQVNPVRLSETAASLDMLDLLLVRDDELENLSADSKEALDAWERKGGSMIIAGGEQLNLPDAEAGGTEIAAKLLEAVYSKDDLTSLDSGIYYFAGEDYWSTSNKVSSVSTENLPGMKRYVIILAVYILLAGPVLYLVLKRLHVRKYLWGGVAAFAAVFSGIVFIMGSTTRFNAPFVNYVRTLKLTDSYEDDTVEMSVRAPYNEAYSVYVNNDYDISPVLETEYYGAEDGAAGDFSREAIRITYGEEENTLTMEAASAFTEKYFVAENTRRVEKGTGIGGELLFYDGELTGTLTNDTGYDLENAFLIFQNHMVCLGDFPKGSSRDMKEFKLCFYSPGYGYTLLNALLECPDGYVEDVTEEFLDIKWKRKLLDDYLMDGYQTDADRCILVGFTGDASMELMKDSAYKMYGQTLVVTDVVLGRTKEINGNEWRYDPFVTNTAQVISGNYGSYENVCYSKEVILEYTLPQDLSNMQLEFTSEAYFDTEDYRTFGGEIEIYCPETRNYTEVYGDAAIGARELRSYLSEDGKLLVKYCRKAETQDKSEKLPVIIVKGRVINAEN